MSKNNTKFQEKQERDDYLEFEGTVLESNKGIFKVQVADDHIIMAKPSGKMTINDVRIIVGDKVICRVSPYNLYLGRISQRLKK